MPGGRKKPTIEGSRCIPQIKHQIPQKLKPIKYTSAVINIGKRGKKFPTTAKKSEFVKKKSSKKSKKEEVDEDLSQPLFYKIEGSLNLSKETKRNRRYSDTEYDEESSEGNPTQLLQHSESEPEESSRMKEQKVENSIKASTEYTGAANDRKISILQVNSCEKSPISKVPHQSDDKATYQASTYYSNAMNKSSKKSRFKFSSDFFPFEDGEVNQDKNAKKRELIGILSDDEFEKYSSTIEKTYNQNTRDSNKCSQKRPFSSCVEDPKAEDDNSL